MAKAPTKMSDKRVDLNAPHDIVACDVCMTEIPAALAKTFEGPDYVLYFCGLECLGKWQAEHGGGGEATSETRGGKP